MQISSPHNPTPVEKTVKKNVRGSVGEGWYWKKGCLVCDILKPGRKREREKAQYMELGQNSNSLHETPKTEAETIKKKVRGQPRVLVFSS